MQCVGYLTMWWWGVRFAVHPRAWVVHSPHPDGPAKAVTRELDLHQEVGEPMLMLVCLLACLLACLLGWFACNAN